MDVEFYVVINILVLELAVPTYFMMFLFMVFLVLEVLYVITELFMVMIVFVLAILTELCYVTAELLFLVLQSDVKRLQLPVRKPWRF